MLRARDITVQAGDRPIVSRASFALGGGEFVGLIGPNGAGKSTLLRAILGLQEREQGAVELDDRSFAEIPPKVRARKVAFLPQEHRVEWRLTGHDVVMLGRYPHQVGLGQASEADHEAVARALDAVGMRDAAERAVADLSGGERARILLARALAVESEILLVDEPIAALDPYQQLHLMEVLRARAHAGAGVLAVMHDLTLAVRFMDRLILMSNGEIVADGPPMTVLSPERLRDVYQVSALSGDVDGVNWVLPWARTDS